MTDRIRLAVLTLAVALALGGASFTSLHAQGQAPNACFGAGSGTNAVVRFYMAIDQRAFRSAYQCFSPSMARGTKFKKWKRQFASRVATRLMVADDQVPNGTPANHVLVIVNTVNQSHGRLRLVVSEGVWHVDQAHDLFAPKVKAIERTSVKSVPNADPQGEFTSQNLRILKHLNSQVTGAGIRDGIYLTTSATCHKHCHSQEVWIYSGQRLVFQQRVDDAKIIPWKDHLAMQIRTDTPGTKGFNTSHPSSRTYVTWFWTNLGFVFHSHKVVQLSH
ncbi:MAG TPA: hypothetical protein VFB34_00625 [Chloroflexota bacterium]|nr:hypothetical protein [Chloroflexota bacterium]